MFKTLGSDTGGAFSFFEREMPSGVRMTPAHRHDGPEGFYVLTGALEFHIGNDVIPGLAEMHQLWSSPEPPTPDQEREIQRRHGLMPA